MMQTLFDALGITVFVCILVAAACAAICASVEAFGATRVLIAAVGFLVAWMAAFVMLRAGR